MRSFAETFNPFDHVHLNEYFSAKATGKEPDFGVPALGWLPLNWQEIAESLIADAFVDLLQRQSAEPEQPSRELDLTKLIYCDIVEVLKGVPHPDQTELESAYRNTLSAAIKLKNFLVEMEIYCNSKGKLQ